jgi:hypothetical protein
VWAESGVLLLGAHVTVTRVYLGDDRRVHYRGYVTYRGREFPFDSVAFRKDPARVIEGAVVRGHVDPPRVHPALVPYLAHVIMYLRRADAR